jgi:predicted transcriptional regulator
MEQLNKLRTMPVSALMSKEMLVVDGSATVAQAIQMMKSNNTTSLIIRPRNDDDTYGIVSERDILEKVIDPGEDLHE